MYIKAAELIHSNESNFVSVFLEKKTKISHSHLKKFQCSVLRDNSKIEKSCSILEKEGFFLTNVLFILVV